MRKFIVYFLQIAIPLAIGIFLIWYVYKDLTEKQKEDIIHSFGKAKYGWVVFSVLIGILSHIIRAVRWNILVETLGSKPRIGNSFCAVMIGYLANFALPRLGEVLRCSVMNKYEKVPFNKLLGTVIIERSADMLITLILTAIIIINQLSVINNLLVETSAPFLQKIEGGGIFIFMAAVVAIAAFFFLITLFRKNTFFIKIKGFLLGILEGIKTIFRMKRRMEFIFYSLLIWFLYYVMFHVCLFCMDETSGVSFTGAMAGFVMGGYGIILVQGGIGAFPAFVMKTLALYQVPEAFGYAFGWILWTGQTLMIIFAGVAALLLLPLLNRKKPGGITNSAQPPK